ncbi:unnamed protein product, partial [Rotaria sordida]
KRGTCSIDARRVRLPGTRCVCYVSPDDCGPDGSCVLPDNVVC